MTDKLIEDRKQFTQMVRESRKKSKPDRCLWCGKVMTRFCDSHTIPQMVLRNIDTDGKLGFFNTFLNNPLMNKEQGIAEATVFRLICSKCDGQLFQEYENPENLINKPTQRMLTEIALKNLLNVLYKRQFEIEFYELLRSNQPISFIEIKQAFNKLDKRDFLWEYHRLHEMMNSEDHRYKLITWDKVDYKVPVAFQGPITLYGDLKGNLVQDIYDESNPVPIKKMHLCVFPLDNCSVIFTFYHGDDTEYDLFAEQLRKMNKERRLKFLGYLMFFISEDMMIAKEFPYRMYFLSRVQNMFMDHYEFWTTSKEDSDREKKRNLRRFLKWREDLFPSILTERYSI